MIRSPEQFSLKEGERLDDLQIKGYRIIQNPAYFCFGMDAVLLSSFAQAYAKERVLDLCTGTGVIPLLMHAKSACRHFSGMELHKESADMARRSVQGNHLTEEIRILCGDVRSIREYFPQDSFEAVTCNPPYIPIGTGRENRTDPLSGARHEVSCTLEDAVRAASLVLKMNGRFYMVHRPSRLAEMIRVLSSFRLEPKRIRLVYPYVDHEPNMILVEARKGSLPGVKMEPPLIVYREKGVYTDEIYSIYGMSDR